MTHLADHKSESPTSCKEAAHPVHDRIRIAAHFIEGEASGRIAIRALIIITMIICGTAYGIFR